MSSRKTRIPLLTKKKPPPLLASPASFRKQSGVLIVTNLILIGMPICRYVFVGTGRLVVVVVVAIVAVVVAAVVLVVVLVCVCDCGVSTTINRLITLLLLFVCVVEAV